MTRLSDLFDAPAAPLNARAVNANDEWARIDALPRRDAWREASALAERLTAELRAPGGSMALRLAQAVALAELRANRGLFGPIGVGQGKTLLTMLAPLALGVERCVVMLPVGLRDQWLRDLARAAEHWRIDPRAFTVVPYSTLSTARGADALERARPELVVCDEAHALRHPTSARTKRVARYLEAHPGTAFAALSGTVTARSLRDYAHLAAWALRGAAPVPLERRTLDAWSGALDEGVPAPLRYEPGALLAWCGPDEAPRDGFRRRMVESPGVVATTESALGTGLELYAASFRCTVIARELAHLEAGAGRWSGVANPLDRGRLARELANGFFYEWVWPNGKPDLAWIAARNAWLSAVADHLAAGSAPGLDSPALLAGACARGAPPSPALARAWASWEPVRGRPAPPRRTVRVSDAPGAFAASWVAAEPDAPAIVWTEHAAAGEALARAIGCPWFGEGSDPGALSAPRTIVASIKAHGVGRNLQAWARALVMSPPGSGAVWEQLLARLHRPGQRADTVAFTVAQTFPAQRWAMLQARRDARYIEATTGQAQKLNLATWVNFDPRGADIHDAS